MMLKRTKTIVLPHGGRSELAKIFNKSLITVCAALDFKTDSALARKIRKAALERGGYECHLNRVS